MRRGTALFRLCPSAASCSPLCLSILHTPLLAFGFSLMTHSPELLLLYKSRRCVSGSRQCSPAENTQEILIKSGHNVLQMREIKKSGYYNNGLDLYGAFLDTQSASWVPGSIHSHTAILVVVNYDTAGPSDHHLKHTAVIHIHTRQGGLSVLPKDTTTMAQLAGVGIEPPTLRT